jgi:BlaI family penicillinase repressor
MNNEMIPTKTEMDVLMILWKDGPSTVRFVHDKLNEQKNAVIHLNT